MFGREASVSPNQTSQAISTRSKEEVECTGANTEVTVHKYHSVQNWSTQIVPVACDRMLYLCSHEYTTEYYLLAGPCLCSEDYSSCNIHCHHPSVSEFWYTLESYTACVQVRTLGEGLVEGLEEGLHGGVRQQSITYLH